MFFSTAAQLALRMESMRKAEAGLVALARRFGNKDPSSYTMELFDTEIPSSVLPFRRESNRNLLKSCAEGECGTDTEVEDEEHMIMHAIRVSQDKKASEKEGQQLLKHQKYPLVIIHGYMNGALYFYRNLVGLAGFFDTVISVDLLGWGLSSRPSFDRLRDDSVETAEAFFVESLESWRSKNNIEKMNLAGHSMGGYLSVAYCEKYPERVERLLLLSPVGVPEETAELQEERKQRYFSSFTRRLVFGIFGSLWEYGYTPGSVMRLLPEGRGRYLVDGYVRNRLPAIQDPEEQRILSEYMYTGSILPGSGEYGLSRILNPGALAKNPCVQRIPKLRVKHVSFLYGMHDWMDARGGLDVQRICNEEQPHGTPDVEVYKVNQAGHLLMLENSVGFNTAVVVASGGDPSTIARLPSDLPVPVSHPPSKGASGREPPVPTGDVQVVT
mmetsp:Transcript_14136/g.29463  ORF Transcript_14136/g.29463 Transcript_14136/m.29463 type:complete len:442 (+) Transcript_14136:302-1627(+)|eukprot:CAMPEP_0201124532 /NCGR_PEP_ID=MMETSP0850-20130426/14720_1 /ASSEMBLY_ACC=CAM_ASM_000622 /TAXON_ID=183588 /ORGANISM="Pseudo-nitzschia fraudulenta, Strain WWA7" /LENGTH=441 /DNA_ID=CAMNT_0047391989 /DNA_START=269 /DNA_END=1594 /DNA_ORIENTATION=-